MRVGGVQDVGEHHILIPIRRRGHHPDIAGVQLVERAREERMRDVGSTFHIIKLPCRWDPAEPKLARSSTMPFPEKDFPILKPPDKFAIHPGLGLIDGKIRRVQEHLEHRVVAACGSVPAKKHVDRSLAQLFKRGILRKGDSVPTPPPKPLRSNLVQHVQSPAREHGHGGGHRRTVARARGGLNRCRPQRQIIIKAFRFPLPMIVQAKELAQVEAPRKLCGMGQAAADAAKVISASHR